MRSVALEESGQGLVEYALMIVLIAAVAVIGVRAFQGRVMSIYDTIMEQYSFGGE